jgi:pseudaminic acid synthase
MKNKIKLGSHYISPNSKPYIIAELSGNHNGSLQNAIKLVKIAAKSGAQAIKLQTFKPDQITLKCKKKDFKISDKSSPWKGKYLYDLFQKAYTPWHWHKKIFDTAKKYNLDYLSTPFHEDAVDYLNKLNVPFFKIASFENNHIPLIEKIAKTNKPVLISTGMATFKELKNITKIFKKYKNEKLIFLKCVSSYPATHESFNLKTIEDIKKNFNCLTGLSDHSLDSTAAISALSLGAKVFEKHITINNEKTIDSFFSSDEELFKTYVQNIKNAWKCYGKVFYGSTKSERSSLQERRSLYVCQNIKKGERFTTQNIKVIRPSFGLSPKYFNKILNKKSKKKLFFGQPFKKEYF